MRNFAFIAAAALVVAGPVTAQNWRLQAISGSISLNAGFRPDPFVINMTAGGSINANRLGGACRGMISDAPDYELTYSAGSLPLAFRTNSSVDTTLVVNAPDGRWYCDDDSNGNLNARVLFNSPRSGTYDVWVGTYNGGYQSTRLEITELP